jgi:glycosyltransferase involved in cell wall biosynthesis
MEDNMIAITAFFAPPEQTIRKYNFLIFQKHLEIPLIVVEWSPEGVFHIREDECDHLIQITSGSILWQKEALLNIGMMKARALGYDKVALLDADIVFLDPKWTEVVSEALDNNYLIQCYSEVRYLPETDQIGLMTIDQILGIEPKMQVPSLSFVHRLGLQQLFAKGEVDDKPLEALGTNLLGNPGLATAINISRFSFKLYDANIVGAGDLVLFSAANGLLDELFEERSFSNAHQKHIISWAQNNEILNNIFGFCDLHVAHLWHGDGESRGYLKRFEILSSRNYNPSDDIKKNSLGLLEFTEWGSRLICPVGEYMERRKDG